MNVLFDRRRKIPRFLLLAVLILACGQVSLSQTLVIARPVVESAIPPQKVFSVGSHDRNAGTDMGACHVQKVTTLPGSHEFAADFIETMAVDPGSGARNSNVVWGLTADLSSTVHYWDRAIYISKSTDGGRTWTPVARVGPRYFNAKIGEGLRNGLGISPGGRDFVITTQEGAFQVFPRARADDAVVKRIAGPRVPRVRPPVVIPKKTGDPVRANVVLITADSKHMIVGYGYFDLDPQLFTYHRDRHGAWIQDGTLPRLPTNLDIFSMQFDDPEKAHPDSLYVGTGDQAFRLDLHSMQWTRVQGVGPDSAIHSMSTVGGPHLAACWGVYNPVGRDAVSRVTHASFLLHRGKDQAGPNIRAYSIEVDPRRPNRDVLTAITGVYTSDDSGETWKRLNNLPEGEYYSSHINGDGSVIVSGLEGTFLVNPFSSACAPQLRIRKE